MIIRLFVWYDYYIRYREIVLIFVIYCDSCCVNYGENNERKKIIYKRVLFCCYFRLFLYRYFIIIFIIENFFRNIYFGG